MTALQSRFLTLVDRLGENFTIGGVTHRGIFGILPPSVAGRYVVQAVLDASDRPFRSVYTAYDDTSDEADIVTWNSVIYTIRRVVEMRVGGVVVSRLLVLTEGL